LRKDFEALQIERKGGLQNFWKARIGTASLIAAAKISSQWGKKPALPPISSLRQI
jgi:hypothetical protein